MALKKHVTFSGLTVELFEDVEEVHPCLPWQPLFVLQDPGKSLLQQVHALHGYACHQDDGE